MTDPLTRKVTRANSGERTATDHWEADLESLLRSSCPSTTFPWPEVE